MPVTGPPALAHSLAGTLHGPLRVCDTPESPPCKGGYAPSLYPFPLYYTAYENSLLKQLQSLDPAIPLRDLHPTDT